MKVAAIGDKTHNPSGETRWVSRLRENLTSGSYGEGLETGRSLCPVPRQSFTRQDLLSVPAEDWSKLRFALHPSVSRLSLQWNAPQLMRALTDETESASVSSLIPAVQPGHWLVYRKPDRSSGWHSLSDREYAAVEQLQQGASFGNICAYIAGFADDDAALQAAGMLRHWVELGLLVVC